MNETQTTSTALIVPGTGEVVDLADYRSCAYALDGIRNIEAELRSIKLRLSRAIYEEAARLGVRQLDLPGGRKASFSSGIEKEYDAVAMERELREAGMPENRIRQLIVLKPTVVAAEAKRAADANPEYSFIIAACTTEKEVPVRVSLRRS